MEFKHTKGPLTVKIEHDWPFSINTIDVNGDIVFSRDLSCYSTKDKHANDAIYCVNFPIDKRDEYSAMNQKTIADETIRAAAPEMLESMIEMYFELCEVAMLQDWHDEQFRIKIEHAKIVIGKATGMTIDEITEAMK